MAKAAVADDPSQALFDLDRTIHAPARLMIMTYLYVVDSVDYVFLTNLTGMTWGNLASHLNTLEAAGYVETEKSFVGKKPHTLIKLTGAGRQAFRQYKGQMQSLLADLPD
jgi:DNA-binding MarR family transcriptional regulator